MSACHVASYYFHTERNVLVVMLMCAATAGQALCICSEVLLYGLLHTGCFCSGTGPARLGGPACVTCCAYAAHMPYRVVWSPVQCMVARSSSRRRPNDCLVAFEKFQISLVLADEGSEVWISKQPQ
jgi:hypothetical protein